MTEEANDLILQLPLLEPDRARAERIRAQCRGELARHRDIAKPRRSGEFTARLIEPAVVGGLCLVYLTALVLDVLRLLTRT